MCIENNIKIIGTYWIKNPDQRLTQVLVNTGSIANFPGLWYYVEETDWLVKNKYLKFEDIHFWGRNFTKDGKKLKETEFVLLKDLTNSHIKNILRDVSEINQNYKKY